MKKTLIYATALTLALISFNSATYGSTQTATGRVPHIYGSVQFPQTRWRLVRHSFRLVIPQESKALSQLSISVPDNLIVKGNISVSDKSGRKINTDISVDGSKIMVTFSEPVAPGTRLKIAMNDVKISGRSNAWLYRISTRLVGIDADLPIGIARFRAY